MVVATRLAGNNPATQLCLLPPNGTAVSALPRFPSDNLPPLAVAIDDLTMAILVAVDLGASSRILRLSPNGAALAEQPVADLPGRVVQLEVVDQVSRQLLAAVRGANADGLWTVPLSGGPPLQTTSTPGIAATTLWIAPAWQYAYTANDITPGVPAAPLLQGYDLQSRALFSGFFLPTTLTSPITGIALDTAGPNAVLSFQDGTFAACGLNTQASTAFAVSPAPPAGGAVAMKTRKKLSAGGGSALVLGGLAYPNLYEVTFATGIAGPLLAIPGDPVDFSEAATGPAVRYGRACPFLAPDLRFAGAPRIGSATWSVALTGFPSLPSLLVLGFDGHAYGTPPALPGGCPLLVAPSATVLRIADLAGAASVPLPIPNVTGLIGLRVYAQWWQWDGVRLLGSNGGAFGVLP